MECIVITGLSGSGKSIAIHALEDIGVYCIDNLPPQLLQKLLEFFRQSKQTGERVAVVADARSVALFSSDWDALLPDPSEEELQLIFLDASTEEIINRYKMTRRRHPLLGEDCATLTEAIEKERRLLAPLRERANLVLDTSLLSSSQLRRRIQELFVESSGEELVVNCSSFGFKYGVPSDADLVFDVRCLPNPFYQSNLKELCGLDEPVQRFVLDNPMTQGLLQRLYDLLDYMLPLYRDQEHKSQLGIAIGCTGGRHRSVALCQALYEHLKKQGYAAVLSHRDIQRQKFNH